MKAFIRSLIFNTMRRIILKYFHEGCTPIMGTNNASGTVIAWKWVFYDEKYEKIRYRRKVT
jgi:hypothetical protein